MSKLGKHQIKDFISQEQIQAKVKSLGEKITKTYQGESIVMLGVLKGSFIFLADLCRNVDLPVELEFIGLSSYKDQTTSSGKITITSPLSTSIKDKHILIVEDIFDTGLTLKFLLEHLEQYAPKSLKICTLLKKELASQIPLTIDFYGFSIPNEFVVGYGLDVAEHLRHLPMISILQKS